MKRIYLIGDNVKFILSEKCLIRLDNGSKVKLRASAAFCLLLLLENHGKLVTHDELYKFGWERFGMTASLNVLHNTIFYLRKMLNQAGDFESGIIETIHRRGFIFNLQVTVALTYINMDTPDEDEGLKAEEHELMHDESDSSSYREALHDGSTEEAEAQTSVSGAEETPEEHGPPPVTSQSSERALEQKADDALPAEPARVKPDATRVRYSAAIKAAGRQPDFIHPQRPVKKFRWSRLVMCFSLLLIIICAFITYRSVSPGDYVYSGKLGQCEVYQNNRAYKFQNLKMVGYLEAFCKTPRILYLTSYPYTNKISSINCREKISLLSDDICYSNYFIYKNNGYNYD
ncbi:winged helix-turn-helix domain-containing protein [Pantoea sp. C2G6]|uniref:winged helix-turn-helix domain-containing protein n=1 Tax=Pantoea sp. C2G6 TaxID=3243084 RepID=UPI003ED919A7